jgi:hypothetical protein
MQNLEHGFEIGLSELKKNFFKNIFPLLMIVIDRIHTNYSFISVRAE